MNRGKMTPEKKAAFALNMAGWDRDKAVDRLQKRMEDHIDRAMAASTAMALWMKRATACLLKRRKKQLTMFALEKFWVRAPTRSS